MEPVIQRTSISRQVMDHILNLVDKGELRRRVQKKYLLLLNRFDDRRLSTMKKVKTIYIVIAALVLLTVIAAAIHFATRADVRPGTLRVEYGGTAVELSVGSLELEPVRGTVRNGKGEEKAVDGQGVPLAQVLERAGVGGYSTVTVTAGDEYSAVVTAEEAAEPNRVFLLLEEDGSLRLVVFGDGNSKRNVSNVKLVSVS